MLLLKGFPFSGTDIKTNNLCSGKNIEQGIEYGQGRGK